MDPPHTAISEAPWGVTMPGHLTNNSALGSDASPDLAQNVFEGLFNCASCGKQYIRLCDLNKHNKTHSRPFKCPVESCRYYDCGWPTEKELDRHFNDKHSTQPRTFSCLWYDCNYSTKRESNCKQHMEKVHGYQYVRSRAGIREEDAAGPLDSSRHVNQPSSLPNSKLAIRTLPNVLLTPSSLEQPSAALPTLTSPPGLHGPIPRGQDIYNPWNSPVTRFRNNETYLQEFPRSYSPGAPVTIPDHEWLRVPVDLRLYNSCSTSTSTPDDTPTSSIYSTREELFRALPTIVTPKSSPVATNQVLTPISDTSPIRLQQSVCNSEATTPQDVEHSVDQGQSSVQGLDAANSGYINSYGKRQVRFESERRDDSDEEDEPPIKRTRGMRGVDDDDSDPKMFCPFRVAHPEIYDVEMDSRYSSCHTEHIHISTVVRHLGRPAHNLKVDNGLQAIHSFDVRENEHGHPSAGLCKKCWRSFTDRQAFDAHFRSKCETASRSKREKFQALIDTFCVTDKDLRSSYRSEVNAEEDPEDAEGEVDVPISATSSRSQSRIEDVVSRREYQTLVDRVAALEQMLTGIRSQLQSQSTPRTMPDLQNTVARAFTTISPAMPSQAFGYYSFTPDQGSSSAATPGASRDPRTSIVGGSMGAAPGGGVDHSVAGFYNDTDRITPTAYRTDSVSTVQRTSPLMTTGTAPQAAGLLPGPHHQGIQAFGSAAGAAGEAGVVSQQSTSTLLRNQWLEHDVQVGDEMMMRGMNFFHGQGSAGEDLAKYLNMNPQ